MNQGMLNFEYEKEQSLPHPCGSSTSSCFHTFVCVAFLRMKGQLPCSSFEVSTVNRTLCNRCEKIGDKTTRVDVNSDENDPPEPQAQYVSERKKKILPPMKNGYTITSTGLVPTSSLPKQYPRHPASCAKAAATKPRTS